MGTKWEIKTTREWSSYGRTVTARCGRKNKGRGRREWETVARGNREGEREGNKGNAREREKKFSVGNNKDLMLCVRIEQRGSYDLASWLVPVRVNPDATKRIVKTFTWHVEGWFVCLFLKLPASQAPARGNGMWKRLKRSKRMDNCVACSGASYCFSMG